MMTIDSDVVSPTSEVTNKTVTVEVPLSDSHAATAVSGDSNKFPDTACDKVELINTNVSSLEVSHISEVMESKAAVGDTRNEDTNPITVEPDLNGVCNGCSKISSDKPVERSHIHQALLANECTRISSADNSTESKDFNPLEDNGRELKDELAAELFVSQVADAMSNVRFSDDGNIKCLHEELHRPANDDRKVVQRLSVVDVPLKEDSHYNAQAELVGEPGQTAEQEEIPDDLKCQRLEDGALKDKSIATEVVEGVVCHLRHSSSAADDGDNESTERTAIDLSGAAISSMKGETQKCPSSDTSEASKGAGSVAEGEDFGAISYVVYESERQMPDIMRLITRDLSEPYSIYTYRYFIHNWPHLCFLAMDGEKCIGAIVSKLDLHKKVVRRGYIAMLAVDQEYRRRSIGSQLVKRAIRAMVASGCDEVVLETEISNRAALHLYENLGFVRDKRLFRYYLNGVDALRLKLWLR